MGLYGVCDDSHHVFYVWVHIEGAKRSSREPVQANVCVCMCRDIWYANRKNWFGRGYLVCGKRLVNKQNVRLVNRLATEKCALLVV